MSQASQSHPAELLHVSKAEDLEDIPPPLASSDALSPDIPSPQKKLKKSRSLFSLRGKGGEEKKRRVSLVSLGAKKDTEDEGHCWRESVAGGEPTAQMDSITFTYEGCDETGFELPLGGGSTNDLYRWAILYENQRGFTLFATPHYSARTLLPNDPAPFTIPIPPESRKKKKKKKKDDNDGTSDMKPSDLMRTPFSLRDYQLPDAQWSWVSKAWMVDMRGDGEVCSSGFQYNWMFREHGWRPYPGTLNSGSWVRRRRWVRLMTKPADPKALEDRQSSRLGVTPSPSKTTLPPSASRRTLPISDSSASLPSHSSPSRHDGSSGVPSDVASSIGSAFENTWRGDCDDWMRCRLVMRYCTRDGKKLEKWRHWLGLPSPPTPSTGSTPSHDYITAKLWKGKGREGSEDIQEQHHLGAIVESPAQTPEVVVTEPVPDRKWVMEVLKNYAGDILHLFVFPDSRAQFLDLLEEAGIQSDVIQCFPASAPAEFWSRRCSTFLPDDESIVHEDEDGDSQSASKKLSIGGVEKKVSTD